MKSIKKAMLTFAAAFFCFSAISGASAAFAGSELTVFAAASLTESLNQIAGQYKKVAPDIDIAFNFDSSGTLKTQIEQGACCDIFISAAQKQMDQLDITADPKVNPKKLDFVLQGTRFNLVSNKVVMVVPKRRNPKGISDFKDAVTDKVSLIAIGNADVPVGQYAEEIYKNLGLWDRLKSMNKISYASNVKEVLAQVESGSVDCGIVYSTDAATSRGVDVVAEAPKGSHKPVVYPAAILKITKNEAAARAFMSYLKSDAAAKVFKSIGFSIPEK